MCPNVLTDVLTLCHDSHMTTNMNTADGLYDYLNTLPTANLEAIAARPVFNAESAKMIATAGLIVDMRKVSA